MLEPSFETPMIPEKDRFESLVISQKEELEDIAETPLQRGVSAIIELGSQAILEENFDKDI